MTKGFVLTMDAALALTTALLMIAVIIGITFTSQISYLDEQQLYGIGNDFLAIMDLSKNFSAYISPGGLNPTIDIGQKLDQLLPKNYCGNVTVSIYSISGNPPTIQFDSPTIYRNTSSNCVKTSDLVKLKRIFVSFDPPRFGLAEMELWLR